MRGLFLRSIENWEPIEIIYLNSKGKISQRTIHVLSETETNIKAYCFLKKQLRTFKKDNILSGQVGKRLTA